MTIPNRVTTPSSDPRFQWITTDDGSLTLHDTELNESYHSGCGAIAESWHVYIRNSGVLERLRQSRRTSVLEYGLGTATCFLLTAAVAERFEAGLEYWAFENAMLPLSVLRELALTVKEQSPALSDADELAVSILDKSNELREILLARLESVWPPAPGCHHLDLTPNVQLRLCIGDATQFFESSLDSTPSNLDAVFFDPFSPATNASLWNTSVFASISKLLGCDGKLVSYCVKSEVRKSLVQAGFEVSKLPGPPGGKREVLSAGKAAQRESPS